MQGQEADGEQDDLPPGERLLVQWYRQMFGHDPPGAKEANPPSRRISVEGGEGESGVQPPPPSRRISVGGGDGESGVEPTRAALIRRPSAEGGEGGRGSQPADAASGSRIDRGEEGQKTAGIASPPTRRVEGIPGSVSCIQTLSPHETRRARDEGYATRARTLPTQDARRDGDEGYEVHAKTAVPADNNDMDRVPDGGTTPETGPASVSRRQSGGELGPLSTPARLEPRTGRRGPVRGDTRAGMFFLRLAGATHSYTLPPTVSHEGDRRFDHMGSMWAPQASHGLHGSPGEGLRPDAHVTAGGLGLLDLPDAMVVEILSRLDRPGVCSAARTCRDLLRLASSRCLWDGREIRPRWSGDPTGEVAQ
jgi:hypothetical protein